MMLALYATSPLDPKGSKPEVVLLHPLCVGPALWGTSGFIREGRRCRGSWQRRRPEPGSERAVCPGCCASDVTVFSVITSRSASSRLLVMPCTSRLRTSCSRSVSPSRRSTACGAGGRGGASELDQEFAGQRGRQGGLSASDGVEQPKELVGGEVLEEIPLCAAFDRFEQVRVFFRRGQHDYFDVRLFGADEPSRSQAVKLGHVQIHEHGSSRLRRPSRNRA